MYATEKYVKAEARELRDTINTVASDLGGDISYLHSMVTEMQTAINLLTAEIHILKEGKNNE